MWLKENTILIRGDEKEKDVRVMKRNFKSKLLLLLTASMLALPSCKQKEITVEDYGDMDSSSSADSESGEGASENKSELYQENSGDSLVKMLGSDLLQYKKDFDTNGKGCSIDVEYKPTDTDMLAVYSIEPLQEAQIDEQAIVKNLLGDTATPINSDDRKYLNVELGDSEEIVGKGIAVAYHNKDNYNMMGVSCLAWVEKPNYYIHTYEGKYNGITYQLLVSYSKDYNELVTSFYPKVVGDLVNDPSLDLSGSSSPDGKFYYYYHMNIHDIELDALNNGSPNPCTLSDEEIYDTANTFLAEKLNLSYPTEAMSLYANVYDVAMDGSEPKRKEYVFLNDEIRKDEKLTGAVRNGYGITTMFTLCDQKIMLDNLEIDSESNDLKRGNIGVDDSGVFCFSLTTQYNYKDKLMSSVKVIPFEKAMDSFVEEVKEKLDVSVLDKADATINFSRVELTYFPVIQDVKSKGNLIPAWSIEAYNEKRQTVVRVIIDATDGSYITALQEPK